MSANPTSGLYPGQGTSSTSQPGFVTNVGPTGAFNHQQWVETVADYLASKWAHGDHTLPPDWNASYGSPNASDGSNPSDVGSASPVTLAAFARYAAGYKQGSNPGLEAIVPYVAPAPNDFVEDPAVTAARIANDHWEKTFGQTATQQDRTAWQQAFANELTAYGYAQTNNQNANNFAGSLFAQASANTNAANSLGANVYGTQAGIYNANENNKVGALQNAGSLAQQLQAQWDARTNKAIDLKANPQDMVAREYATRALQGPQATGVPGYSDVSQYQDIINKLMNYSPGAQPTAPTPQAYPTAPTYQPMTTPPPTQTPFQQWQQQNGSSGGVTAPASPTKPAAPYGGSNPLPNNGGNNPNPFGSGGSLPGSSMSGNWQPTVAAIPGQPTYDPNVVPDASGYRWDSATQQWRDPNHGDAPYKAPAYAYGSVGTDARRFVAGDPQADGAVNPEVVHILHPGPHTTATVTPLPHFAYGTPPMSNDSAYMGFTDPRANKSLASMYSQKASDPYASSIFQPWAQAHPDGTDHTANTPQYGQPSQPQTYTPSKPLTAPSTAPQSAPGIQAYTGTGFGTTASGGPQVYLPSYSDTAYQNFPSLQYAQGLMSQPTYNTLDTGLTQGAFGAQIPGAGRLNYNHMLDIMNNPDSYGALQSLYASGNRNLLADIAAAKARAPFGQAVNTSLVRT